MLLSDVVAELVSRRRRALGLSREQLAEMCAAKGLPLSAAAIANIETGRRVPDGRRRREVTVDELVGLAGVLKISPVLLVFPVGSQELSEFRPGMKVDTWRAAQWFGGHGEDPTPTVNADRERVYRLPMRLYAEHEQAIRRLAEARANVGTLRERAKTANGDIAEALRIAEENLGQTEEILTNLRQYMRDQGINPPAVTERTAAVVDRDEERS